MSLFCTLESVRPLGSTTYLVRLRPEHDFSFTAGQYVKLDEGYYSIASPPESPWLEFIVRSEGRGTAADLLVRMPPGERVTLQGPFGKLGFKTGPHRHACFIGQGTGISPLFSIVRSRAFLDAQPLSTTFLVGFRDEAEIVGQEALGSPLPPLQYHVALSQPREASWKGLKGRVTEHLKAGSLAMDWKHTEFYLCGSLEMLAETRAILLGHGVEASSIHSEL